MTLTLLIYLLIGGGAGAALLRIEEACSGAEKLL
jgi:hypothetical protein